MHPYIAMEIRRGVYKLRSKGCNVYLLRINNQKYLVDTGTPNNASLLLSQIKELDGIIITHAHFDHIGSVYGIQIKLNCPVFVHKDDLVYLVREKRFRFSGVLGKVASLGERVYKIGMPVDVKLIDELIEKSDENLEIIHTPGHTPGSICILYNRCLICGDLVRHSKKYHLIGKNEVKLSPKSFCSDYNAYLNSVRKILELDFDVILPGHGLPIYGKIGLESLVKALGR